MSLAHRNLCRRGWVVVLLTALFLLGDLQSALHLTLVRHVICREHGEFVDVRADAPAGPIASPTTARELGEPAISARTGALREADAHEHCGLAVPSRPPSLSAAPIAPRTIVALAPERTAFLEQTVERDAFPQFLLAPKHSPPL